MPATLFVASRAGWWTLVGLFFAGGIVQLFISNALFMEILDLVNRRLSTENQISQFGANWRAFETLRLYHGIYPQGTLHVRSKRFLISGFLFFGTAILIAFLL